MTLVPFVPIISAANVGAGNAPGFVHNPAGLLHDGAGAPASWRPDVATGLRPASVPSPLALAELTRFVIERARPQHGNARPALNAPDGSIAAQLLRCSELMLEGLVSGALTFRWTPASALATAGRFAGLLANHRIGMIRGQGNFVWGYMLDDGIPVLSGALLRPDPIAGTATINNLQTAVRPGAVASRAVPPLLATMKRELAPAWDVSDPWMALVDRVLGQWAPNLDVGDPALSLAGAAVSLADDVRSIGPFRFTVGVEGARSLRYLLAHSPAFVTRLRRVLSTPDAVIAGDRLELSVQGNVSGTVSLATEGEAAGAGLVVHLVEAVTHAPPPSKIHDAWASRVELHQYVDQARQVLPSLTQALTDTPMRLCDVVRAATIAIEGVPLATGPKLAHYLHTHGLPLPNDAVLASMRASGRAVVLPIDNGPDLLLCEDAPVAGHEGKAELGELSLLGTSLWLSFSTLSHDSTLGYSDELGQPLFSEYDGCPLYADPDTIEAWWSRGPIAMDGVDQPAWQTPARARSQIATLQRFAGAYASLPDSPMATLLELAAARFLGRLLGDDDVMRKINTPRVGGASARRGPAMSLAGEITCAPCIDPARVKADA